MIYSTLSAWLDICNECMIRLNRSQLQSLDEASSAAYACNRSLPIAIAHVLSQAPWRSARKRAMIAPDAQAPEYGFSYRYRIPMDFIRVVEIDGDAEWERESGYICTDQIPLKMIYVACPEQPGVLDPLLQEAIICTLTAELAMSLISDSSLMSTWLSRAELAIAKAKLTEDAGKKDTLLQTNSWGDYI